MKKLIAVLSVFSVASIAAAQWDTTVPGNMSTQNSIGIGQGTDGSGHPNLAYGNTALRLGLPLSSGCGPGGTNALATCLELALGTSSSQWWGLRLDTAFNLHFDRQADNGWAEGVIFNRSGDVTFPANINLPNTHIAVRTTPFADTTLRLAFPLGVPDQCGTVDRGAGRCFQMALGTGSSQWWGFRLDPSNNLYFDRQTDNAGWQQAVKFDRNGTVTFAGDVYGNKLQATYQDVAEWVPAAAQMAPGTVVVLSPDLPNEVMPSASPYDTTVAGVVSAEPGVLLGQASASKAKIATAGRVKVHVDASKSPIRIGDLLVTSDRSGAAMRSDPIDVNGVKMHRPGTLIGKALEPLSNGQGEILVLLSLQ